MDIDDIDYIWQDREIRFDLPLKYNILYYKLKRFTTKTRRGKN